MPSDNSEPDLAPAQDLVALIKVLPVIIRRAVIDVDGIGNASLEQFKFAAELFYTFVGR